MAKSRPAVQVGSQRLLDRDSAANGASTARMRLMTQIASEGSVRATGEAVLEPVRPLQRTFCDQLFGVLPDKEQEQPTVLLAS